MVNPMRRDELDEKAGDPPGWGPGAKIDGISIDHSSRKCGFYFQRGVLMVPDEALDELLAALGGLGDAGRRVRVEPIEGTGITQVRVPFRRPTDVLIDELGGSLPVEPGYIAMAAPHIKGLAAARPASVNPDKIPTEPRRGKGKNVSVGVVDLGFFSPEKAGHPSWAIEKVVLDKEMQLPDPTQPQFPYVGHGNAIIGIIKQLAPEATVYTSTIQSSPGDAPGGTSDRRLGEAIERLLSRHRVHILVIPFGGSTRHGLMPVTERVLQPHVDSTLILASAGNDGVDPTVYPAADPDVMGTGAWRRDTLRLGWLNEVCATVMSPHAALGKYRLAGWSNQGIAAQLGAPGVAVPAPFIRGKLKIGSGSLDTDGPKTIKFDGWGLFTGTSFSVAVAAGCIAGTVSGKCAPSPEHLAAAAIR
jgi:hypothetical protein